MRNKGRGATATLVRRGYPALGELRHRGAGEVVELRLFGVPVTCVGGVEGARRFYDESSFARHGAVPGPVQRTLFGLRAVHTLDDEAHEVRKRAFTTVLSDDGVDRLAGLVDARLREAASGWTTREEIVLFDEAAVALLEAAAEWAGVPLDGRDHRGLAIDLTRLVDGFGTLGARHWRARLTRQRVERWLEGVVRDMRHGASPVAPGSPIDVFLRHHEADGSALDDRLVAVEMLNLLRPTVAIAWFVTFAAHALFEHPDVRQQLKGADRSARVDFVHEVRRHYPFAPALGARARRDLDWCGVAIPAGRLVVLDVYGTNHDPDLWPDPERFDPNRFLGRDIGPYDLIPQGGGDTSTGHRCPGEALTVEVMARTVRFLIEDLHYRVPSQRLRVSRRRFPARVPSGMVLADVRRVTSDATGWSSS